MLLISAMIAMAAPLPLPGHANAGPIEGFVAVWVDPADLVKGLVPVEPGAMGGPETPAGDPGVHEGHAHPTVPGGLVVLELDEGVALDELVKAMEGDEALARLELNADRTAILVDHPDLVSLLARPLGKGTVGDAVSIHPVPSGILRMPGAHGPATIDLPVENVSSARAVVSIGGTEIGVVGPYARAVIHGVPAGRYEIRFRLPNGYVRTALADTGVGLSYEAPYRMR
ncbi:MAG: hypothetical protein R3F61_34425 [Myxococcota bacterium]